MEQTADASVTAWVDLLAETESLGYASVWTAELHFNPDALSAVPALILAALATRTRHIRLGYGVKLLAFHHPLHIAEELATLQQLSNGRIIFGVGKGTPLASQNALYGLQDTDLRARMYDSLQAIRTLWENRPASYASEYFTFREVTLSPPTDFPFPETVIASFGAPESLEKIAQTPYALLLGSPFTTEELAAALGQTAFGAAALYVSRFSAVDTDHRRARRRAEPFIRRWAEKAVKSGMRTNTDEQVKLLMEASLIGDSVFCREQIEKYRTLLRPESILVEPVDPTLADKQKTLRHLADLMP